jgi:hypothetical protein
MAFLHASQANAQTCMPAKSQFKLHKILDPDGRELNQVPFERREFSLSDNRVKYIEKYKEVKLELFFIKRLLMIYHYFISRRR